MLHLHLLFTIFFACFMGFSTVLPGQDSQGSKSSGGTNDRGSTVRDLSTHQGKSFHLRNQDDEELHKKEKITLEPRSVVEISTRFSESKPEKGEYRQIRIIDLQGENSTDVNRKLTTHQMKGKIVYVKKEEIDSIDQLGQENITGLQLSDSSMVVMAPPDKTVVPADAQPDERSVPKLKNSSSKALTSFIVHNDGKPSKLYKITEKGEYLYYDGEKIVGGQKYERAFPGGFKPITPITFYYQVSGAGNLYLESRKGLSEFLSMTVEEQARFIEERVRETPTYIEIDSAVIESPGASAPIPPK